MSAGRPVATPPAATGTHLAPHAAPARAVQGRWISEQSARDDLGLLRPAELALLRRGGTERHVEAGTVVAASGSRVPGVLVVLSGELELRARLDRGRATMAVVRTGGVIADIPLLLEAPMPFDAVATRESTVLTLSLARWTELLSGSSTLSLRWMASIARRLDADRRRLVVVTTKPLVAQVAWLLLDLAEEHASGQWSVRLSHATLAQLLGARRQSVTRVLGDLRQRGLVRSDYATTVLLDREGLRDVVGREPLP